ncbi:MAG: glycosyltransferase family 2 protein, partial [Bacillus sp. (in: Bacteria)]|nr:glycosyltransferase family 2 protein [Bacillus sp. (in: firmicutes)]
MSAIIPVYNKAPFLRRCLNSIVKQTDSDAQVIIIDDGSTDDSGAICDEYKKFGFEVHHTKNRGVSEARNLGIKYAKSEWLTFMDADDSFEPRAFEIMKRFGDRNINNIIQFGH